MIALLADEHRRVTGRRMCPYVDGRTKGIEKFAVLVEKYWDIQMDYLDDVCETLLQKAAAAGNVGDHYLGFIKSIERCRTLMWYVRADVMDIEFPSGKQLYKISLLEQNGYNFNGITKEQASEFISQYS